MKNEPDFAKELAKYRGKNLTVGVKILCHLVTNDHSYSPQATHRPTSRWSIEATTYQAIHTGLLMMLA
jgi:hypothetical protein